VDYTGAMTSDIDASARVGEFMGRAAEGVGGLIFRAAEDAPRLGRKMSELPLGSSLDEEDFAKIVQVRAVQVFLSRAASRRDMTISAPRFYCTRNCACCACNRGGRVSQSACVPPVVAEASCSPFEQESEGASCTHVQVWTITFLSLILSKTYHPVTCAP
jgi:hypothetical protein